MLLVLVLAHLLVYPTRREEERLSVGMLTALHVREFVATTRASWPPGAGQRWHRYWKRRRRAQRAKLHASPSWRAWVAQLLPDPNPLPWAEQAALAAWKRSVEGLFHAKSEVEYLNGAVVRAGKKPGVQTPIDRALCETLTSIARGEVGWSEYKGQVERLIRRTRNGHPST